MAARKVPPLSRSKIRELAKAFRQVLGLENVHNLSITKIYEILVEQGAFELEILEENEMGENEGLTYPNENRILIREDVYEGACQGVGRHRLTLAHEIGHWLIHKNTQVSYARNEANVKPYEDPEWQANCFAGELLVPYDLCKDWSVFEIEMRCRVSGSAAATIKRSYSK